MSSMRKVGIVRGRCEGKDIPAPFLLLIRLRITTLTILIRRRRIRRFTIGRILRRCRRLPVRVPTGQRFAALAAEILVPVLNCGHVGGLAAAAELDGGLGVELG